MFTLFVNNDCGISYHRKETKTLKELSLLTRKQLTIELVPKTAWFSNIRSMVSRKDWDVLRKEAYKKANHKCEICGEIGKKHPVECHEIWQYDDENHTQKLIKLIALCPACHEVKHIGFANTRDRGEIAEEHLSKVNGWSEQETSTYVQEQFVIWRKRSCFEWKIDLTWLEKKGIKYKKDREQ